MAGRVKGQFVGRDDRGRAMYVDMDYREWVPSQVTDPHFRWPPRALRRAEPVASRRPRTTRVRKAHQRILRVARRYGWTVKVA